MIQRTIVEEILDDFIASLKNNPFMNENILEKLNILREDKLITPAVLHSILKLEEEE